MEIATLLPDSLYLRVRAALLQATTLSRAVAIAGATGSAASLAELLDARQIDLVVVDPSDQRAAPGARTLADLIARFSWVPFVMYAPLTHAGIQRSVELVRSGARALVVAGHDDQPAAWRALVDRLTGEAVAGLLLGALARPLAALPEPVAGAIHELFGAPHRFPSVADLASAAGVSVRHLQRLTTAVGFTRPAELLVVARVMRAHQLLQSPGMTLEGAAARVRVEARILSRHVRRTTGETRAMALRHLSPSALVTHCTRTLYRPPAALARAAGDRPGGA